MSVRSSANLSYLIFERRRIALNRFSVRLARQVFDVQQIRENPRRFFFHLQREHLVGNDAAFANGL